MAKDNVQKDGDSNVNGNEPAKGETGAKETTNTPKLVLGKYKSEEEAAEGLKNLESKLGTQGTEMGVLKKQVEFFQSLAEKAQAQPTAEPKAKEPPKGMDYGKEIQAIEKKMSELDSEDPSFPKDLAKFSAKLTNIAMKAGTEQGAQTALEAAQAEFSKVLDERDVQSMHKEFYRDNPDFNTPDMQMRIQEQLTNDTSGMSDPVLAYREIQRDDALVEVQRLSEENEEAQRLLNLKKGEDETGKVIVKGQSPSQQKTREKKLTGAELDEGAMGVLANLRNA